VFQLIHIFPIWPGNFLRYSKATYVSFISSYIELNHRINQSRKEGGLGGLNYPLLSDFNKKISQDYDVLIEGVGLALRGTFLIDPNGVLRQMSINDLPVGRSVDEYLRLVKAFQFVEKHGEVCPANWDPKSNPNTIKPSPVASKEYFSKQ